MHLVIDQGNTTIKVALFSGEGIPDRIEQIPRLSRTYIDKLLSAYPISSCIYSSVAHTDTDMMAYLQSQISHFYYFTPDTPLPVTIDYRSPKTLGSDRIAAVIGARSEAPDRDILVIDAGTCITYDMITATGHFLGGNIAPGIKMRLRSMNKFTEKLPVVEKNGDTPGLLIFLTGGDAFLLADKLKTSIFVDDCIVLKGLNRILYHNVYP